MEHKFKFKRPKNAPLGAVCSSVNIDRANGASQAKRAQARWANVFDSSRQVRMGCCVSRSVAVNGMINNQYSSASYGPQVCILDGRGYK